ncbi:ATP-binding cassette domain-containing protein [Yoonia sp. 208BN28-4]|uniref:ATP-binding cassette domain-containing protein n=1 Tax=Yoonia sp. 208BN28-4 TaxID=3126505 RepID=UPI0030EC4E36
MFPLHLRDVSVRRHGKTILGPVTHQIGGSGLTVVMGPNGSGKTTLLRAIHGVERLSTGQINWAIPAAQARDLQAYVFQQPIMLRRSVADNLRYPLMLAKRPTGEIDDLVTQWLARIALSDAKSMQATRLSGGERQKLALARALISDPAVLFLDEPCANLDGRATKEIETLLTQTLDRGTRIMMATHDIGQARRLATDVLFMLGGVVHETGVAPDIFATPQTAALQAFLRGDIVE